MNDLLSCCSFLEQTLAPNEYASIDSEFLYVARLDSDFVSSRYEYSPFSYMENFMLVCHPDKKVLGDSGTTTLDSSSLNGNFNALGAVSNFIKRLEFERLIYTVIKQQRAHSLPRHLHFLVGVVTS